MLSKKIKYLISKISVFISLVIFSVSASIAQEQGTTLEGLQEGNQSSSQDLTQLPKISRDLILLESILADLIMDEEVIGLMPQKPKGAYILNKGVIFQLNRESELNDAFFFDEDPLKNNSEKETTDYDKLNRELETELKNKSIDFLLDYCSVLTESLSNEIIIVHINYQPLQAPSSDQDEDMGVIFFDEIENSRMISTMKVNDILSFQKGEITREEAVSRVSSAISNEPKKENQDAKIMASVFDGLYQSYINQEAEVKDHTTWTYYENLGLIYELTIYNNLSNLGSGLFDDSSDLDQKIDDNDTLDMERLIEVAKESLVTYGRTLKSVAENEVVMININVKSDTEGSNPPDVKSLQILKSSIDSYTKGTKSLEEVKKEVVIR